MITAYRRYQRAKDDINSSKSRLEKHKLEIKFLEEQKRKAKRESEIPGV